ESASVNGKSCTPARKRAMSVVGDNSRALQLAEKLRQQGCWVTAIRPPTVPAGTARLRLTLTAAHEMQDIDRLLEVLHGNG
ncbi:aminotransferase class I/II-fold pyridoxal phosphate-dependent enzyme, partial [Escherichia coli]|uniref:aminotransferase class I/II-fold pyridoxal phosphate-dependent enzyme n=1 Tax=Escherichia coli TaxID=562 RepID=UPI000DB55053